ncbi:MAG: hypothetical protein V3V99_11970 [candidate division Zixibacteria bacterium]
MGQRVQFGEFWFLYLQTLKQMKRAVLWSPLLILGLLTIGLAAAHYYIFSPVLGPLLKGWLGFTYPQFKDAFFHYPNHFVLLPLILDTSVRVFSILVEALFLGIFSDLMISVYRGEKPAFSQSFGRAVKKYIKLTSVWGGLLVVLYLLSLYYYDFLTDVIGLTLKQSPRRQVAAFFSLHFLAIAVYSPFIFIIPSIMAGGSSLSSIIGRALKTFIRHPIVAFGIVLIPYVISATPGLPLSFSARVVEVFNPEMIFYLILTSIVVSLIANFIMIGTAVKFFMDQNES